ncbi:hypothetical protein SynSYN20_02087 [Synechococcus sp. SYN20]|nr:hypothetical protein SynSYN20_02087 [Synechococcus sp. SYN20]
MLGLLEKTKKAHKDFSSASQHLKNILPIPKYKQTEDLDLSFFTTQY